MDVVSFDKKWWMINIFALIGFGLLVGVSVTSTLKKCPECPSCQAPAAPAVEVKK